MKKPILNKKIMFFTIGQVVTIAAAAASFAAIATACLASHMFNNSYIFRLQPFETSTMQTRTTTTTAIVERRQRAGWNHNYQEEYGISAMEKVSQISQKQSIATSSTPAIVWLLSFPNR